MKAKDGRCLRCENLAVQRAIALAVDKHRMRRALSGLVSAVDAARDDRLGESAREERLRDAMRIAKEAV